MHIPQAGDEEFASAIDDSGSLIRFDSSGRTDGRDSAGRNDNGLIALWRCANAINDGDVLKNQRWFPAGLAGKRKNQDQEE
jgi:hypothetical protein